MAPYDVLERAGSVRDRVSGGPRISVTELARSNEWRDMLPDAGVIEITDRGGTAAWLLSPGDMQAIVDGYAYLEEELERAQVAAIFKHRADSSPLAGDELESAVRERWEARKDELRGVVYGDR